MLSHGSLLARAALGLLLLACGDDHSVEDSIDAKPGLSQLGQGQGDLLDEAAACELMAEALRERQTDLSCDNVQIAPCPALIRPAGSLACLRYYESSVTECVERIEGYQRCKHFRTKACLAVAALDQTTPDCTPPGPASGDAGDVPQSGGADAGGLPDAGSGQVVDAGNGLAVDAAAPSPADAAVASDAAADPGDAG